MARTERPWLAAVAIGSVLAAEASMIHGLGLRFHIENTDEALADESHGTAWLLGSAALFMARAAMTRSTEL